MTRTRLAFVVVALMTTTPVLAQIPSQAPSQQPYTAPAAQSPSPYQRGTRQEPVFTQPLPAEGAPEQAEQDQKDRERQDADRALTRTVALGTLIVGFLQLAAIGAQAGIAWYQARITERQRRLMRRQAALTSRQSRIMADQLQLSADSLATSREIERAYVRMSYRNLLFLERKHITPNRPETHHDNPDTVDLVVELKNIGKTAGDVMGGWCGFLYQEAHESPKLLPALDSSTRLIPVFLPPGEMADFSIQMTLRKRDILFLRRGEPVEPYGVLEGEPLEVTDPKYLWLVGVIDYRDRFGHFHRAGYGTRWDRQANRFVFDPSVVKLNYDRPLSPSEAKKREYDQQVHEADA